MSEHQPEVGDKFTYRGGKQDYVVTAVGLSRFLAAVEGSDFDCDNFSTREWGDSCRWIDPNPKPFVRDQWGTLDQNGWFTSCSTENAARSAATWKGRTLAKMIEGVVMVEHPIHSGSWSKVRRYEAER